MLIRVAMLSEACVRRLSLAGVTGSKTTGAYGCLSVVSVVCCQVEVFVKG